MSDVKNWSQIASENADPPPDGAPEGQPRTDVNDIQREAMASVRRELETPGWFDKTKGPIGLGFTLAKVAADKISLVHETTPTDATSKFIIGSRIRVGDGATFVYGYILSMVYANPTTTITLDLDGADVVQATPTIFDVNTSEGGPSDGGVQKAAFSPRGTTLLEDPPQIPSIDDLGDGATVDQGSGNGFDADTVDGQHAADIAAGASSAAGHIAVINGDFSIAQRGYLIDSTTYHPNDNGLYVNDQWVLLMGDGTLHPAPGSGVVDVSRVISGAAANTAPSTAVRLTANANLGVPNHEKVGLIQWIESESMLAFRSGKISLSYWARSSSANISSVRITLVSWSGTADALGASVDPVSDWSAEGVVPIPKAQCTFSNSASHSVTPSWQQFTYEDVTVPGNANNLGIMIWLDDTSYVINDWVEFTGVSLVTGSISQKYVQEDVSQNMMRCSRYYHSSFDSDQAPVEFLGNELSCVHIPNGGTGNYTFPVEMRIVPVMKGFTVKSGGTVPGVLCYLDASIATESIPPTFFISRRGTGIANFFQAIPYVALGTIHGQGINLIAEAML